VLFEIEPATWDTIHSQKPVTLSLQYKLPNNKVLHELKAQPVVQYQPYEKLDQCYQFAGSVAMFGLLLRNSDFVKDAGWNELLALATRYSNAADKSQQEFVTLVQQAKSLYGKRKRRKE
jgi:Ca-activated chloride channel family protein